MAGHSKRSLADKLGVKSGPKVFFGGPSRDYFSLLGPLPEPIQNMKRTVEGLDPVHFFACSRQEDEKKLPELKKALLPHGALWVSRPKAEKTKKRRAKP